MRIGNVLWYAAYMSQGDLAGQSIITASASSSGDNYEEPKIIYPRYGYFQYKENRSDGITIVKYTGSEKDVIIPDMIAEKPVTEVGVSSFSKKDNVETVTIPDTVTNISPGAFRNCPNLKTVNIPDSVRSIGYAAFEGCSSLETVVIPEGATWINENAFYNCSSLTSVTMPSTIQHIGKNAFRGCSKLTDIAITDGLKSIRDYAFCGCEGLTEITIPGGVTNIGSHAFDGCTGLTQVEISDGVTSIGDGAFTYCKNITELVIPDTVKSLGCGVFVNCESLTSMTIPDTVTRLENSLFYNCTNLEEITLPDSVAYMGRAVFAGTKWLENKKAEEPIVVINGKLINPEDLEGDVVLPDGLRSIDDKVFENWNESIKITSITIPASVTSIGKYAFCRCYPLTSVTILGTDTIIDNYAFMGCRNITILDLSDGVKSVGGYAFADCDKLKIATLPGSLTQIGYRAFGYSDLGSQYFSDFKVWCTKDSAGEKYAKDHKLDYEYYDCTVQTSHIHRLNYVNAIEPTFEHDGNIEYWYCTSCKKYYSDENAKNIIDKYSTRLRQYDRSNPYIYYESQDKRVLLSWSEADLAEEYAVVGYKNDKWCLIKTCLADQHTCYISNLVPDTRYKVCVLTKRDGKWCKDYSNAQEVTPISYYPSVYCEKNLAKKKLSISWDEVKNAEKYAAVVYQNNKWVPVKQLPRDVHKWYTPQLASGTYRIAVAAKVDGKWVTEKIFTKSKTITIE